MTPRAQALAARPSQELELPPLGQPSDPAWLSVSRRRAAAWVRANGFPSSKQEDWRYTSIDPVLAVPLVDGTGTTGRRPSLAVLDLLDLLGPRLGAVRLVMVNGHLAPELSQRAALPGGARILRLEDALADNPRQLASLWSWRSGGYPHALRALSDALATDGVLIDLPAGAVVEEPIEVVLLSAPGGAERWSHPRVVVAAGAASRATVIENYLGAPGRPSVTNALTQVMMDDEAQVDHYVMQADSTDGFHFSSLEVRPGRASHFSSRLLAVGARIGRHEVQVALQGEDAEIELSGLFLTGAGQVHDNPVLVDHAAPGCRSRQLYKGVAGGDGRGVFNGHIVVRAGANGTDAQQINKNLLVSDRAEVDTRPRLEIFADDVACAHGAAVGQLDPGAVFYLRSRGISYQQARALLVSGFAREVIDGFADGPIRQYAELLASAQLDRVVLTRQDGAAPAPAGGRASSASAATEGAAR